MNPIELWAVGTSSSNWMKVVEDGFQIRLSKALRTGQDCTSRIAPKCRRAPGGPDLEMRNLPNGPRLSSAFYESQDLVKRHDHSAVWVPKISLQDHVTNLPVVFEKATSTKFYLCESTNTQLQKKFDRRTIVPYSFTILTNRQNLRLQVSSRREPSSRHGKQRLRPLMS